VGDAKRVGDFTLIEPGDQMEGKTLRIAIW
jgi:hypothetical protein